MLSLTTLAKISSSLMAGNSNSSIRKSFLPYNRIALVFIFSFLVQHNLSTGYRQVLPGFIALLNQIKHPPHHIADGTTALNGGLTQIMAGYILHGLGTRHLSGLQVLHKQAIFRIAP